MWHYEFHNFEPDENGTISMEEFLGSVIKCVQGNKKSQYITQIFVVAEAMGDSRVNYGEFVAFQLWLEQLDILRRKMQQFRYMDFDMFDSNIKGFCKNDEYCKKHKIKISDDQIRAIFILLDQDESGELEYEEIADVL